MTEKMIRPRSIESKTVQVNTGCGHMYVIIGFVEDKPVEIFASLGKSGGCSMSQNEALGRAISLGLQYGVPIEEYIDEFRGIRCPKPLPFPKNERCLSCAEGISIALADCLGIDFYNKNGEINNEENNEG